MRPPCRAPMMQLSLSPSPSESNLASQLLGSESSGTAPFDGHSEEPGAPFSELFPDLDSAPTSAAGKPLAPLTVSALWIGATRAPGTSLPSAILPTHGSASTATMPVVDLATMNGGAFAAVEVDEFSGESDQSDGFFTECSDAETSRGEATEVPCALLDSIVGTVLPVLPIPPSEVMVGSLFAGSAPAPQAETAPAADSPAFGTSVRPGPLHGATRSPLAAPARAASAQLEGAFTQPGSIAAAGISVSTMSPRAPLVASVSGVPLSAVAASSQDSPTALSALFPPVSPGEGRALDLAALPAPRGPTSSEMVARQFTSRPASPGLGDLPAGLAAVVSPAIPPPSLGAADDFAPMTLGHLSGSPFAPAAAPGFAPPAVVVPPVGPYVGQLVANSGAPISRALRASAALEGSAALPVSPEMAFEDPALASAVAASAALADTPFGASALAPSSSSPRVLAARDYAPFSRGEKSTNPHGVKIAASAGSVSPQQSIDQNNFDKTSLNVSKDRLKSNAVDVGTDIAIEDLSMSAATLSNRPAPNAVLALAPVVSSAGASDFSTPASFAPEIASNAQQAVEAVLTAAERVTSRDQQAVDLHFLVGGADLRVRVELRANQVHATFHSDSAELNSALAREWQGSVPTHGWQDAALVQPWALGNSADSGDRSLRLAPPVFTTSAQRPDESSLAGFSGGDGSSQQRGAGARRGQEDSSAVAYGARSASRPAATSGTVADSVPNGVSAASRGTRMTSPRLHTHA